MHDHLILGIAAALAALFTLAHLVGYALCRAAARPAPRRDR